MRKERGMPEWETPSNGEDGQVAGRARPKAASINQPNTVHWNERYWSIITIISIENKIIPYGTAQRSAAYCCHATSCAVRETRLEVVTSDGRGASIIPCNVHKHLSNRFGRATQTNVVIYSGERASHCSGRPEKRVVDRCGGVPERRQTRALLWTSIESIGDRLNNFILHEKIVYQSSALLCCCCCCYAFAN